MYLCVSVWDIGMNDIVLAKKIAHDILEGQTISIDGLSIQKYKIYNETKRGSIVYSNLSYKISIVSKEVLYFIFYIF